MGCGRRSVKSHLSNQIYFNSNLSFVLFEAYKEIVRKACIASFPVDRPALALATTDSIETENPNLNLFLFKFLIFNQNFGAVAGEGTARFSQKLTCLFFLFAGTENRKTNSRKQHIATLCLSPQR